MYKRQVKRGAPRREQSFDVGPDRQLRGLVPYSRSLVNVRLGLGELSCDMAWQAMREKQRGRAQTRLMRRRNESRYATGITKRQPPPLVTDRSRGTSTESCNTAEYVNSRSWCSRGRGVACNATSTTGNDLWHEVWLGESCVMVRQFPHPP